MADFPPVLEVRSASVRYGTRVAIRDLSLKVCAGEIVAIMGPNGSGKSSILRAVAGLGPWFGATVTGQYLLDGEDVTHQPPYERVRAGMVMVPQGGRLFPSLSVYENLISGYLGPRHGTPDTCLTDVLRLFPRLKSRFGQTAASLSGGEQQMVAIGRALMLQPRSVMLLDEPTAGLASAVMGHFAERLREIAALGTGLLLVEQNVEFARAVSTRTLLCTRSEALAES